MGTALGPNPISAPATLRPDIAEAFTEWDLDGNVAAFRGTNILTVIDVAQQAGTFPRVLTEDLAKLANVDRAPGAGYSRGSMRFTTDSFSTEEKGREELIDDNLAAKYKNFIDAEMVQAKKARNMVMADTERTIAALVFNATTFTPTAVTNEWDKPTQATPITDVEAARERIYARTGMEANALIISRKVARNLRNVEQIIDRIEASGAGVSALPGQITAAKLAEVFDLPYVIVCGGSFDTARENVTSTFADIWDDEYAMVTRIATSADFSEPCLGRTFHWAEDGSMPMGIFEEYYSNEVRSKVIRFRRQLGSKLIYPELGDLLSNITQ